MFLIRGFVFSYEAVRDWEAKLTPASPRISDGDAEAKSAEAGTPTIVAQENVLTVSGSRNSSQQQLYLHHGIASRVFERRFNLADYVKVANADLVNGLLTIDLVREIPEAMRPRQIQIGGNAQKPEQIEQAA